MRYRLSLYAHAYALLVDPAAAEQVVLETFERAWRSAQGFNPDVRSAFAWLSAIARELTEQRQQTPVR